MRLKCLTCEALARVTYFCAARSSQTIDIELFHIGLHNTPAELRSTLQERIDLAASPDYDAVVLVYGLCGQSTAGLQARHVPVVIPRAHDCITLFLGGRTRYREEFDSCPGTYWYTADYVQRATGSETTMALGTDADKEAHKMYREIADTYGEENAEYLLESMGAWHEHYQRAVFIDMGVGDSTAIERHTREQAARRDWSFDRIAGDMRLVQRLLDGDWENDFLVLQPGRKIAETYNDDIIDDVPAD